MFTNWSKFNHSNNHELGSRLISILLQHGGASGIMKSQTKTIPNLINDYHSIFIFTLKKKDYYSICSPIWVNLITTVIIKRNCAQAKI